MRSFHTNPAALCQRQQSSSLPELTAARSSQRLSRVVTEPCSSRECLSNLARGACLRYFSSGDSRAPVAHGIATIARDAAMLREHLWVAGSSQREGAWQLLLGSAILA
jgi:hypothetical protein